MGGERTERMQVRYGRGALGYSAIIKVAQRAGSRIADIRNRLQTWPSNTRVPTADGAHLSTEWRNELDDRIARLTRIRDQMSSCIGCGCLSIDECPLRNPYDELSEQGSGPRLLDPD